jgi:hypothetical protein
VGQVPQSDAGKPPRLARRGVYGRSAGFTEQRLGCGERFVGQSYEPRTVVASCRRDEERSDLIEVLTSRFEAYERCGRGGQLAPALGQAPRLDQHA